MLDRIVAANLDILLTDAFHLVPSFCGRTRLGTRPPTITRVTSCSLAGCSLGPEACEVLLVSLGLDALDLGASRLDLLHRDAVVVELLVGHRLEHAFVVLGLELPQLLEPERDQMLYLDQVKRVEPQLGLDVDAHWYPPLFWQPVDHRDGPGMLIPAIPASCLAHSVQVEPIPQLLRPLDQRPFLNADRIPGLDFARVGVGQLLVCDEIAEEQVTVEADCENGVVRP